MKKEFPKPDSKEDVYPDHDEDSGFYGVFGVNSGHCYAGFADEKEAEKKANEINKQRGKS